MGVNGTRLKRSIGLRTVVSTSAGLTFASSTFLAVVQMGCYMAGDSAWIAIVIAGALCAIAAAAFSELNGMWPSVNGIRLYIYRAFGEKLSLIISLTYMSVATLVVGTEAFVLSHVLNDALRSVSPLWWIFLMLTAATVVNILGLKIAGAFQDIITYSVVASILVMSVLALGHAHLHAPQLLHTGGVGPIFQAVGIAVFLFVGFEWVTPLADEVRDTRQIPTGMFIALAILVVAYGLITTAMFAGVPGAGRSALLGTAGMRQPVPHILFAAAALGPVGRWVMIATSLCMSLTTFNAGLIGVSRFIYSMGRDEVLPKVLGKIAGQRNSPVAAVLAVYVIALAVSIVVYVTEKFLVLVNVAAATESFIYAVAAASVIRLRVKDPARARPFRMWGGLGLPAVTAVLFLGVGLGVFAQPGIDYWGAGAILIAATALWGLYIHFIAMPRLTKNRIAAAEKVSRRASRRPAKEITQVEIDEGGET